MKTIIGIVVLLAVILLVLLPMFSGPREAPISRTAVELSQLRIACQAYRQEYGEFPTGTVSRICRALAGDNPKKIVFIEFAPKHLASDGSLLDPWRTPYRIRFSETNLSLSSAGKDQKWDTADDIKKE